MYATGNYYTDITIEEYKKTNRNIWNETDSQAQAGTWYCVEGSCQHLRQILKDNKFMGGILVDQFYDNPGKLSETIEMNLRRSDGLMVFDIVHIIQKNLWKEVEKECVREDLYEQQSFSLRCFTGICNYYDGAFGYHRNACSSRLDEPCSNTSTGSCV